MGQRRVISYLVLPRVINAGLLVPAGYIVARLGGAGDGSAVTPVAVALVAWLAFDVGLYQGRYLVNDLLDVKTDSVHPDAERLGRLAGRPGMRRKILIALAVRLVVVVATLALLPDRARVVTVVAVVALGAATLAYESARARVRRNPVDLEQPVRWSSQELAVVVAIGSGYALRVAFGVALGGGGVGDVAVAAGFGWLLGELIMVMAWTLEVTYLHALGGAAVLERKSHVLAFRQLVGDDPSCLDRPLWCPRPARAAACLMAAVSALAVAVGVVVAGSPGVGQLAGLLAVSVVLSPLVVAYGRSPSLALVPMVLDVSAVLALGPPAGRDVLVFLLLVVTGVVASFRSLSLTGFGVPAPSNQTVSTRT